jgi:hypothetical protein
MRRPVPGVPIPTDDVLSRNGAYLVRERTVPGPDGTRTSRYSFASRGTCARRFRPSTSSTAVVSVAGRLAPETPHPGPVEDSYAGLRWLSEHADELGVDPGLIVAGMSAGGVPQRLVTWSVACDQRGRGPVAGGARRRDHRHH